MKDCDKLRRAITGDDTVYGETYFNMPPAGDDESPAQLPFPASLNRSRRNFHRFLLAIFLLILIVVLAAICNNFIGSAFSAPIATRHPSQAQFLAALRAVESFGGQDITGDGGEAIGPYQIHKAYWRDAVAGNSALSTQNYAACHQEAYARAVVLAYLQRYAPAALAAGDWQTCARIHNGGPAGASKSATLAYWKKVQAAL